MRWALPLVASAAPQLNIVTSDGTIQGTLRKEVRAFLGVPYAADAGGANRFAPPQPVAKWSGVRNTTEWGPGCVQLHTPIAATTQSEDCLSLNVFAPVNAENLPVMFFIYGGGFDQGSTYAPLELYDGSHLAKEHNMVVVTINYRISVFGFLALDPKLKTGIDGNFGLMDQRQAMRWVQTNIKAFGGDPNQVTLFGESAGAMSISIHLANNLTKGLFHRAVMQSGPTQLLYKTHEEAGRFGDLLIANLTQCSGQHGTELASCLRQQDVQQVLNANPRRTIKRELEDPTHWGHWAAAGFAEILNWQPTIDAKEFPEQVADVFAAGRQQKLPLLIGTNADEAIAAGAALNGVEYDLFMDVLFGKNAKAVLEKYPAKSLLKASMEPLGAVLTDFLFRCPTNELARLHTKAGAPTYVYRLDHPPSMRGFYQYFGLPLECETTNVTCHGVDLPFVFHNWMIFNITKGEDALSRTIGDYWTSFASTGTPTSTNANTVWPLFDNTNQQNLLFAASDTDAKFWPESARDLCDFWLTIGYDHATAPTQIPVMV